MNFTDAVRSSLSKFAVFQGRARRSEYWFFYLFTLLVTMGFNILVAFDAFTGIPMFTILGGLAGLALLLPTISVTVRRLHDTGRSGWHIIWWAVLPWVLVLVAMIAAGIGTAATGFEPMAALFAFLSVVGLALLLPLVGGIVLFVFMVLDSKPGDNKYGPAVKNVAEA